MRRDRSLLGGSSAALAVGVPWFPVSVHGSVSGVIDARMDRECAAELYGIPYRGGPTIFSSASQGDMLFTERARHVDGEPAHCRGAARRGLCDAELVIASPTSSLTRVRQISECFNRRCASTATRASTAACTRSEGGPAQAGGGGGINDGGPDHLGLEVARSPSSWSAWRSEHARGADRLQRVKDRAYMELALLAQRLGRYVVIVIDRPNELTLIKASRELGIRPHIGLRAGLAAKGAGKWAESFGDRSKFGLSAEELMLGREPAPPRRYARLLEMLHFHNGSQVTAIRATRTPSARRSTSYTSSTRWARRCGCSTWAAGWVDYDGSQTNFHSSMNYTTQEYAYDVVRRSATSATRRACRTPTSSPRRPRAGLARVGPDLRRAGRGRRAAQRPSRRRRPDEPKVIQQLDEVWGLISARNVPESYNDALQLKEEATTAFSLGYLGLQTRARMERVFWACCEKIMRIVRELASTCPTTCSAWSASSPDTYYGELLGVPVAAGLVGDEAALPGDPIQRLDEGALAPRHVRRPDLPIPTARSTSSSTLRDVKQRARAAPPTAGRDSWGVPGWRLPGDTGRDAQPVRRHRRGHVKIYEVLAGYTVEQVVEGDSVEQVVQYLGYDRRQLGVGAARGGEPRCARAGSTIEESALRPAPLRAGHQRLHAIWSRSSSDVQIEGAGAVVTGGASGLAVRGTRAKWPPPRAWRS